jgi:hypothetical protein
VLDLLKFDVIDQDGTKSSCRKVPACEIHELDGIKMARASIEEQDRDIAARSEQ